MPSYPNRCQHIKVNGTQCGSPALRRNRFCYFHKRHHDERIALHLDQLKSDGAKDHPRRRRGAIDLPVLEDANSIQISLMQIMRLLVAGQLDSKTAGLLLYALQTASANLPRTRFEPLIHEVILDPRSVADTPLGMDPWDDDEFEEEEEDEEEEDEEEEEAEEEEDDEDEAEQEKKPEPPRARVVGDHIVTAEGKEIGKGLSPQALYERAEDLNWEAGLP